MSAAVPGMCRCQKRIPEKGWTFPTGGDERGQYGSGQAFCAEFQRCTGKGTDSRQSKSPENDPGTGEGSAGSKLSLEEKKNASGKLQEKHTDLAQSRGDARKKQTGGSKKPGQKRRLKFAYEETAEAVRDGDSSAKLNRMDADGVNFRHDAQKKRNQKMAHTEAERRNAPKKHSMKEKVYQENAESAGAKKKSG